MDPDIAELMEAALGSSIMRTDNVHGGDFARAFRANLADGSSVFVKTHSNPPSGFFSTEAAGLAWLRAAGTLRVPEVLALSDEPAFLVLEWINTGSRHFRVGSGTEARFGRRLAGLHAAGAESFGRQDQRTTGSLALPNDPVESWADFYGHRRLIPLSKIAERRRSLPVDSIRRLREVAMRLEDLLGLPEAPARLHGDLWAGNRLVDVNGNNWLIDPACFGGHREFDLAMMRLFGGFGDDAFAAYDEAFPLADGWRDRIALHQIAPLVVHAIKFGGGYVSAVAEALDQYG